MTDPSNYLTGIVIAHFHPDGKVPDYMVKLISHASTMISKDIIFVSTKITKKSISKISEYCKVIQRSNIGYDFWSYKIGLDNLGQTKKWDRLLLINSSFVVTDPQKFFDSLLCHPPTNNMVGLTKSWDFDEHVQSFCVLFDGRDVITSPAMTSWWNNMTPISNRNEVIQKHEIGMSKHFKSHGIKLLSIHNPTGPEKLLAIARSLAQANTYIQIPSDVAKITLDLSHANKLNPTHFSWDQLFLQFGIVKLDFLRLSLFSHQFHETINQSPWSETSAARLVQDAYY